MLGTSQKVTFLLHQLGEAPPTPPSATGPARRQQGDLPQVPPLRLDASSHDLQRVECATTFGV